MTSPALTDPRPTRAAATGHSTAAAAVILALTASVAVVVNLVVLAGARAADAAMVMVNSGAAPHPITAGSVVGATAVPLLAGTALAVLLSRVWPLILRVAQVVGGGFAVLSAVGPLLSDSDDGTRIALATMHVVVGAAVVGGLEAVRRRAARPR